MDRYEPVRDLGSGNFGVAKLMRDRVSDELVAIKFIERGERVDRNVEREICNHRMLNHPNIVGFKEVFLTPSHLGIVMEYAAGGELFERIVRAGRFSEDEARYFFQQLISGVDYCHESGVCHRDLKLENTLLDGNAAPRLKICDFGYSKSAFDSQPKSTVGTPAYIAPEVLQRKEYNGQPADVWSCGVTLYVMLVGAYPFEDPADPRNFRKTIQRIMSVKFSFPPSLQISAECQDLISRIFVSNPAQRITIGQIRRHPWFLRNLPAELAKPENYTRSPEPPQSLEEIRGLIRAARILGDAVGPKASSLPLEFNEEDYMDADIAGEGGHSGSGGAAGLGMGVAVGGHPGSNPGGGGGGGNNGGISGCAAAGVAALGGTYLLDNGYAAAAAAGHGHLVGVGPSPGMAAHVHGHGGAHPHSHSHPGVAGLGGMGLAMPVGMQMGMGMAPLGLVGGMGMAGMAQEYPGGAPAGYLAPPQRGYPTAAHQAQAQVAAAAYGGQQAAAAAAMAAAAAAAAAARSGVGAGYGSPHGHLQPQQQQQQ